MRGRTVHVESCVSKRNIFAPIYEGYTGTYVLAQQDHDTQVNRSKYEIRES